MKLRNRIMSWILSPGAYAVWHALGAPEEWEPTFIDKEVYHLVHKPTGVDLWVPSGAFYFDCRNTELNNAIGPLERHLVWWSRAYWVRRYFYEQQQGETKKPNPNHELFVRMTQLTGKPQ